MVSQKEIEETRARIMRVINVNPVPSHTHSQSDITNLDTALAATKTSYNAGTKSSGTFTPDPANGVFQRAINGGAHTLAPPSPAPGDSVSLIIQYTNNGSAGVITTSGFTKVTGDPLTIVSTDNFMLFITVCNSMKLLDVKALQ